MKIAAPGAPAAGRSDATKMKRSDAMKTKLMIAVLFLVSVFGACTVMAQTGTVRGLVTDVDGKPLVGAVVEFTGTETGRLYKFTTDKMGRYQSIGVSMGKYNVKVLRDGQQVDSITNFPVNPSSEGNDLDFDLRKALVRQEQQLTSEQRAAREAARKDNDKVSGLNALLKQSSDFLQAGKFDDAVQVMRKATATDTSFDILWGRLCEADVFAGRAIASSDRAKAQEYLEDAVSACNKAIAIKPAAGYYGNLADASSRLGNVDAAAKNYGLAAELDPPGAARYYFNQAAVLTNAGKIDEANAAFDRAIAAKPDYADAYYQKAINLMAKATVDTKTGSMSAPPEVATNLNKYLELAPTGKDAVTAKQLIETLGAKVETTFGKQAPARKR